MPPCLAWAFFCFELPSDVEEVVQGTREPPKKRRKYASEEERKEAQRIARNERRKNIRKAKRQERESEVFKEAQAAEAFPAGTTIDDALRQVLGGVDVAEEGRQAEEKPKTSSDQEKKKRGRPPKAKADDKDAKTEEDAKATEPQKAELEEVVESDTPKKKRRQFKTDEERREAKRIAQNERRRKAKEALKQAKESEASKESLAAHSPQADASVASAVQQVDMVDDDIEVVEEVRHFEADGDIMTVITL
ncbi:hypothetical protein L596_019639 [Steinernema carpocapsae]|uniref:Uncharacterized protein n=1 Tax=Steinernema carpocapsae TaxID=34508 RepID=A0A4U5MR46_STECR|nr:hypothetical protein L596_019639 [Steinernema carpocapsae]